LPVVKPDNQRTSAPGTIYRKFGSNKKGKNIGGFTTVEISTLPVTLELDPRMTEKGSLRMAEKE
jgi:hypothetical protein